MKPLSLFLLLVAFQVQTGSFAQGTFQNLGFESANLTPIPAGQFGSLVPVAAALPGWQVYYGTNQATQVLQNNLTAGAASVDILGPDWQNGIIEGNYTAVLQAGQYNGDVAAMISQTGLVPVGTQSIQAKFGLGASDFLVSLGGQDILMVPLANGANYTLYGGDVSSFAGQSEELSISALSVPGNTFNTFTLDSIVFSASPIPEPGICALFLCGAGVFGVNRWRRRFASLRFKV